MENSDIHVKRPFWSLWEVRVFVAVLTAMLLLSFWLFVVRVPKLVISEETTRVTGPLTDDGQIDFFKALEELVYPPGIATDDNGFRIFVRLFGNNVGDARFLSEFYRRQTAEKLGLDPNIQPTLTFPPMPRDVVMEYYQAKGEEMPRELDQPLRIGPWTLEQFPMLEDWIMTSTPRWTPSPT